MFFFSLIIINKLIIFNKINCLDIDEYFRLAPDHQK